jgi:hypothetical protein
LQQFVSIATGNGGTYVLYAAGDKVAVVATPSDGYERNLATVSFSRYFLGFFFCFSLTTGNTPTRARLPLTLKSNYSPF